ncbi:stress response protein NST1 [Drosophila serrata]|uniref:stress response protein NST1 n=1 Tax=Drosophila serrata TaxID=7274 RepID=UPI000A1D00D8|nr:stress response protein NST1 [Drosophila serrata]
MSNTSKGVFSLFKRASSRESNYGKNIRRSRASVDVEPLTYLKPHKDVSDRLKELEDVRKEKERQKKELEKKARREERMAKQREHKEKPRSKLPKRESNKLEQEMAPQRKKEPYSDLNLMMTGRPKRSAEGSNSGDDFKQNIETLERQVDNLDIRCKMMATMWINLLRAPTQNEDEIRARNLITAHLVKCRNENIFQKEPFCRPPPSDTLANIKQKMVLTRETPCHDMNLSKRMETKSYLNKLFYGSYDGGKFLSQLPVPRDGAFFIVHMRPNL